MSRRETRDPAWAVNAEAALKQRYATLADTGSIAIANLACAASVCELTGRINPKRPDGINAVMQDLQGVKLNSEMPRTRLRHAVIMFGSNGMFAAYWTRIR